MISVDGSLFIQIANFLLLIWVLNRILYRPIRNMLEKRKEKINGLQSSISNCEEGVQKKETAFRDGIKEARAEGLKRKNEMIQAAEEEEKRIIAKINEKAAAELQKIREKVAQDAEAVRLSLLQEVDNFANEIGEKILGRAV